MPNYAVEYTYDPDLADLRTEHRPVHRAWLAEAYDAGDVLAVGAYLDGSGALLVVRADDEEAAAALLAKDPFATVGAIADTRIREWMNFRGPFGDD
ncbi:MAG: YciI family protein [Gordonia sp. (in: high G+C Gram-positive bacteria)]|uniref:YciI family protein n=1 Tax=Gordonia sp. (in: high G+C Gram-positive bacteria) TaxID=84139 RepID=UPI0039E4F1E3